MQQFSKIPREKKPARHIIGREAAIKMSEIEGLEFTDEMRAAFDALDSQVLTGEQRRAHLAEKFGKPE